MQNTFERYELKYLITPAQRAVLEEIMDNDMAPDQYGRTTIRNLYFDTKKCGLLFFDTLTFYPVFGIIRMKKKNHTK